MATGPRPLSSEDSITTPAARPSRVARELQHFGLQRDRVEQVVDALPGLGREFDHLRVATEFLGDDVLREQFVLDPQRIGVGLVDLVDRDDSGTFAALRVLHRLDRLRHHAVVGGDHQHHDVGRAWRRARASARTPRGPGVSRKLIAPFGVSTWYAPMCWVMPPASPEATLVRRM